MGSKPKRTYEDIVSFTEDELKTMSYDQLKQHGFINNGRETVNRARWSYKGLVKAGMSPQQAKQWVADRMFVSASTVHNYLYRKNYYDV